MPGRRPTWAQLRRFCEQQGFRRSTTDYTFYDKVLPDSSTAGTKLSFAVTDTESVPSSLWPRIWKRQLRPRSEDAFWRGLEGLAVEYDIPQTPEQPQPLPDFLPRHLRDDRHLSEEAIATMSRDEAQRLLNDCYGRDPGG